MLLKKKIQKTTAPVMVFFFLFQLFSPTVYAFDAGERDSHGVGVATADPNLNKGEPESSQEAPKDIENNRCTTAWPISLLNGEETYPHPDIYISGRGLDLEIFHTYKSRMNLNGRWGYGWFLNYDTKIRKLENDNLLIVSGEGTKDEYTKTGPGTYDSPQGFTDVLSENTDGTFIRTLKNGVQYNFDVNGRLRSIIDPNDNSITFEYDAGGKLPINGRSAFFVSQTEGVIAYDYKLTRIVDTVGREVTLEYDEDGRLIKMTDPADRELIYAYDADNNLIRAYEPALPATPLSSRDFYAYAYDDKHNLTAVTNPNGVVFLQNQYNDQDRVVHQTHNGETSTYEYNPANRSARRTMQDGAVMTYQMNECCGNPTKVVRDAGEGRLNLTRTYIYDSAMNMTSETDPRGNTTQYAYDDRGNVTRITGPEGGVTQFEYEPTFNQVTRIVDPLGRETRFGYDNRGNLTETTDDLGNRTDFTYAANGDLLTVTNALGNVTRFSYDAYGNVSGVTDALNYTTEMTYDILGNRLSVTDPKNQRTDFSYDAENQLVEIRDALGNRTQFSYDANGNRTTVTDPLGHTTRFAYDDYERLIRITDPLNQATAFAYNVHGNLISMTDAENRVTAHEYDTWFRRIRTVDALNQATEFGYDANGNLVRIADAKGNATTYQYDKLNRRTRTTYPDDSYETFSYDAVGNLVSKRNRDGETVTYAYDDLGRREGIRYPEGTQVAFQYDDLGRLTRAANPSRVVQLAYNAANRLTQTVQDGKTVRYAYDPAGNRTRLTYPDGTFVTYENDAVNRLDAIRNGSGQLLVDYVYDAAGRRIRADLGNGTQAVYEYDDADRLENLKNQVAASQSVISRFAYAHDRVGNRTAMTTADGVHNYTYDATYQLTGVDYPAGYAFADKSYAYDALGNRTVADGTVYTANELNQYVDVGGVDFSYDGNGNLTSDGNGVYTYDDENRMIQAVVDGVTVTFAYDAFGRRVEKSNSSGAVTYVYDGDQVIGEYDGSANLLRKFVYGTGIDEPVVMENGGNRYFYHFDGLGSVAELTGAGGAVVEEYAYDVFGKVRMADASGNVLSESGVGNPYFFTGRRYDADTGLYHYRARSYLVPVRKLLAYIKTVC